MPSVLWSQSRALIAGLPVQNLEPMAQNEIFDVLLTIAHA